MQGKSMAKRGHSASGAKKANSIGNGRDVYHKKKADVGVRWRHIAGQSRQKDK